METNSWVVKLSSVKMSIILKFICKFNRTAVKPTRTFVEIVKLTLKLIQKSKEDREAKICLKSNKVGRLTLSDFNTYYKAILIKWCGIGKKEKRKET